MRITLHAVPPSIAVVGTAVGYVDGSSLGHLHGGPPKGGQVLSFDGRQALIDGQPVEHGEIAEPLHEAIDAAMKKCFGPDWVGSASVATSLNVRSLSRGRILTHGLPLPVLELLARAVATRSPRAVGYLMLGVAWLWDEHVREHETDDMPGRMSTSGREALAARLDTLLAQSLDLVHSMQDGAAVVRLQKAAIAKDRATNS